MARRRWRRERNPATRQLDRYVMETEAGREWMVLRGLGSLAGWYVFERDRWKAAPWEYVAEVSTASDGRMIAEISAGVWEGLAVGLEAR